VSKLINVSYKSLQDIEKKLLIDRKGFVNIFKNSFIENIYPQLVTQLQRNDIEINQVDGEIHFNNGYMNMKTGKFRKRKQNKHFITQYIKRDYEPSSDDDKTTVINHIKKIYPNKKDFDCILNMLGASLSGLASDDQITLLLLGMGSTGKSFIMELTQVAIVCYFEKLSGDSFEKSNPNRNKIFNSFIDKPCVRIAWVNELTDKNIDSTLFKNFCDGKIETTRLYQDGQTHLDLKCRGIFTSNDMPNIHIDSGTKRRVQTYTHKSKFVSNNDDINEDENIYKKDKKLLRNISKNDKLLNAWFDILKDRCVKWYNGTIDIDTDDNENFKDTKDALLSANDIFKDFVDSELTITKDQKHRIGKEIMRTRFLKKYSDKHFSVQQIISRLKDKGIEYSGNLRPLKSKIQGCFIGVKFNDNDNTHEDPYEQNMPDTHIEEIKSLNSEIYDLREYIKGLEQKIIEQKQPDDETDDDEEDLNLEIDLLF